MTFKFPCPHCGQRVAATDALVGESVVCPTCAETFVVRSPAELPVPASSRSRSNYWAILGVAFVVMIGSGLLFWANRKPTKKSTDAASFKQMNGTEQIPSGIPGLDPLPSSSLPPQAPAADMSQTLAKLNTITFPLINFKDVTVQDAVKYLTDESRKLDPKGVGVPIEVSPLLGAPELGIRLTLELHNIPMIETIKYVTNLANLKYRIVAGKVEVAGMDDETVMFIKRWLKIPPQFFGTDPKPSDLDCRRFLHECGVTFPPGSLVTYNSIEQCLTVKAPMSRLDLIEKIINIREEAPPGIPGLAPPGIPGLPAPTR